MIWRRIFKRVVSLAASIGVIAGLTALVWFRPEHMPVVGKVEVMLPLLIWILATIFLVFMAGAVVYLLVTSLLDFWSWVHELIWRDE